MKGLLDACPLGGPVGDARKETKHTVIRLLIVPRHQNHKARHELEAVVHVQVQDCLEQPVESRQHFVELLAHGIHFAFDIILSILQLLKCNFGVEQIHQLACGHPLLWVVLEQPCHRCCELGVSRLVLNLFDEPRYHLLFLEGSRSPGCTFHLAIVLNQFVRRKLDENEPHGPHVCRAAIGHILWSLILGSSLGVGEGLELGCVQVINPASFGRQADVRNLAITGLGNQDIVGFQVTVQNGGGCLAMKMLQPPAYAEHHPLDLVRFHFGAADDTAQLLRAHLHHDAENVAVLNGVHIPDDVGVCRKVGHEPTLP
mmetsp:Transcript_9058/g.22230  ORF Transcript_9058/g.22230 Transcript_9058/m.22230 type:complete len:314 (-) Transcript_9058:838-1779(-)